MPSNNKSKLKYKGKFHKIQINYIFKAAQSQVEGFILLHNISQEISTSYYMPKQANQTS